MPSPYVPVQLRQEQAIRGPTVYPVSKTGPFIWLRPQAELIAPWRVPRRRVLEVWQSAQVAQAVRMASCPAAWIDLRDGVIRPIETLPGDDWLQRRRWDGTVFPIAVDEP